MKFREHRSSNIEHRTSNDGAERRSLRSSMFDVRCSMFSNSDCRASILIGLLWCLALLSVVVIGFLHTARRDLQVGKNYGDRIQAHYLALSGIEKAKALLYQDAKDRSHNGKSHDGSYYNDAGQFR